MKQIYFCIEESTIKKANIIKTNKFYSSEISWDQLKAEIQE